MPPDSIKILYFASLRERLACSQEDMPLDGEVTLESLRQQLAARGEEWSLAFSADKLISSINQVLAKKHDPVRSGDEVAFFPPVTGG